MHNGNRLPLTHIQIIKHLLNNLHIVIYQCFQSTDLAIDLINILETNNHTIHT